MPLAKERDFVKALAKQQKKDCRQQQDYYYAYQAYFGAFNYDGTIY